MNKSEKNWLTVLAIIVGVVIVWILFHKSATLQQIVAQNAPWLEPSLSALDGSSPEYNINIGGYVPANMPIVSNNKCDSNSPCVLCTIPNATYPTTPKTVAQSVPSYATVNIAAPQSFAQPTNINTGQAVWGRWG